MSKKHRYHYLVLGGGWMSTLQINGDIKMPRSDDEQDTQIKFVKHRVDDYMKNNIDISFDTYIKTALINRFGTK